MKTTADGSITVGDGQEQTHDQKYHTQGEWYTTAGYVAAKTAHGNRVICAMSHSGSAMNYAAPPGSTEDSANASLIAAAPKLRNALVSLLSWCGTMDARLRTSDVAVALLLQQARAALAQAEVKDAR